MIGPSKRVHQHPVRDSRRALDAHPHDCAVRPNAKRVERRRALLVLFDDLYGEHLDLTHLGVEALEAPEVIDYFLGHLSRVPGHVCVAESATK